MLIVHHQVGGPVGEEEVPHPDDVRVFERRQGLGLLVEELAAVVKGVALGVVDHTDVLHALFAPGELLGQVLLDYHLVPAVLIAGEVDQAESAAAHQAHDLVAVDDRAQG